MPNNYERHYYVICDDNCKFEGMTKEQIIAAIVEATGSMPENPDDAFISKILELNKNSNLRFWLGTTAEYNALVAGGTLESDCMYIITDDTFGEDVDAAISQLSNDITALSETVEKLNYKSNGWVNFKDKDNVSIGTFYTVGYTAFFNLNYKVYGDGEGGNKTIDLPFTLDLGEEYINIPCIYHDGITSHDKTPAYAQIFNQTVDGETITTLTVNTPNVASGEYEYLLGSFCLPIKNGIVIQG